MASGGKKQLGRVRATGLQSIFPLSNRGKEQHTDQCDSDGKRTKFDQYQDHAADRISEE